MRMEALYHPRLTGARPWPVPAVPARRRHAAFPAGDEVGRPDRTRSAPSPTHSGRSTCARREQGPLLPRAGAWHGTCSRSSPAVENRPACGPSGAEDRHGAQGHRLDRELEAGHQGRRAGRAGADRPRGRLGRRVLGEDAGGGGRRPHVRGRAEAGGGARRPVWPGPAVRAGHPQPHAQPGRRLRPEELRGRARGLRQDGRRALRRRAARHEGPARDHPPQGGRGRRPEAPSAAARRGRQARGGHLAAGLQGDAALAGHPSHHPRAHDRAEGGVRQRHRPPRPAPAPAGRDRAGGAAGHPPRAGRGRADHPLGRPPDDRRAGPRVGAAHRGGGGRGPRRARPPRAARAGVPPGGGGAQRHDGRLRPAARRHRGVPAADLRRRDPAPDRRGVPGGVRGGNPGPQHLHRNARVPARRHREPGQGGGGGPPRAARGRLAPPGGLPGAAGGREPHRDDAGRSPRRPAGPGLRHRPRAPRPVHECRRSTAPGQGAGGARRPAELRAPGHGGLPRRPVRVHTRDAVRRARGGARPTPLRAAARCTWRMRPGPSARPAGR